MKSLQGRTATQDELCLVHSSEHVELMKKTVEQSEDLKESGDRYNSVYFHPKTFECATLAAGSVLTVVDEVLNGDSRSGVCIVRPPGHHAESDLPHGYCSLKMGIWTFIKDNRRFANLSFNCIQQKSSKTSTKRN